MIVEPLREALGGSDKSTTGGMKKLPSLTRATHVNEADALVAAVAPKYVLVPDIVTYPAGSPPLQVTVAPLARLMVLKLD